MKVFAFFMWAEIWEADMLKMSAFLMRKQEMFDGSKYDKMYSLGSLDS